MVAYNETNNAGEVTGIKLIAAPVVGLLYVILLPAIGIATVGALAVRMVAGGMADLIGKSVSFGWRPMEAYLSGRKKNRKSSK